MSYSRLEGEEVEKETTEQALEKDDDALKKVIRKMKELGEDIEFAVK
jgi:EAL domain-containing protein (putative c-di-GMP-specific phosphodiesterase class I)